MNSHKDTELEVGTYLLTKKTLKIGCFMFILILTFKRFHTLTFERWRSLRPKWRFLRSFLEQCALVVCGYRIGLWIQCQWSKLNVSQKVSQVSARSAGVRTGRRHFIDPASTDNLRMQPTATVTVANCRPVWLCRSGKSRNTNSAQQTLRFFSTTNVV